MEIKQIFLIVSIVVGLISPLIGIYSILKGIYKPQRMTRVIFLIITFLSFATLLAQGDRIAVALAFTQFIGSMIIFLLSFKFGMGGYSRFDVIVLSGAIITLLIWKTTENPTLALYASIATDFIGLLPTIIKTYKKPHTEDPRFYLSDTLASLFSILALKTYLLQDVAYPVYIFIANGLLIIIILLRRKNLQSTVQDPQS